MFIYLSKKIAIPNNVALHSLSWNPEQGWIACGGEGGLLKVLKLESTAPKDSKAKGVAAPSNLSMNQTLDGHGGAVKCVTWNANFRKLTSSDENGLIIVWMLHKGMWFEEMINNRNRSRVTAMQWCADGSKIAIAYEDGAVIVGSVDGNRLWGRELGMSLRDVQWSPDGRTLLFVTTNGEIHAWDHHENQGYPRSQLRLYALDEAESRGGEVPVVGIHWYDNAEGQAHPDAPTLAVAFGNGRVQITRGETDSQPVVIETGLQLSQCRWNTNGSVLALAGIATSSNSSGEVREVSMVQFYNPFGQHLRTLKVPGSGISALSFSGDGLRIALAVQSYIYFANIRPDYKWGFMANTLVYAFTKPDRADMCVVFWDTHSDERYTKYVKMLLAIRAAGENCVLAAKSQEGGYILILCNAIGSPVDSKYIEVEPVHIAMTEYHVIVASEHTVYVWQYRTPASKLSNAESRGMAALRRREGRESIFHINDLPNVPPSSPEDYVVRNDEPIEDAICCLTASAKYLIVGRESGTLMRFPLPHISLENRYHVRTRPQQLALNSDSTRMSIIDVSGILTFFDLDAVPDSADAKPGAVGQHLAFERKDAWDMIWAEDNPSLFALMEKTRMYIFRDLQPEEPALSSGYLCQYRELQIKAIMLDEVMQTPEQPEKDMVLDFETKSLRDARELLQNVGIRDAYEYIEANPHPRLWRLLAEAALEALEFSVADKAFVRCQDYQGIQYVKRLRQLGDRMKQKAEVLAYFQRFDEADAIYREIDRKDLAIELRMRTGDWFSVAQLVQSGGGDDQLLTLAWNKIGDYYAERQKWGKAVQYYLQANNNDALVDCYYILEDYPSLERLARALPEGSPLLLRIGHMFESVGISEHAVFAFTQGGNVKAAIDCCVVLNQWDRAVELAQQHNFPQIEGLLAKYAHLLLERGNTLQAIDLYRNANKATDAARLLAKLAQDVGAKKVNPLRAKKLHVLAALEVERFRKRVLNQTGATTTAYGGGQTTAAQTLDNLMQHDQATGSNRALDNAWRGAEGYHFFMLAQRQLYLGESNAAMKTALRLADYEDVLDPKDIFSLIALTAYYNRHYAQCSRAFIKLESLPSLSTEERDAFAALALQIFTTNQPVDPDTRNFPCPGQDCSATVKDWYSACPDPACNQKFAACIQTGRAMIDGRPFVCRTCRHKAFESELRSVSHCPLCHSLIN